MISLFLKDGAEREGGGMVKKGISPLLCTKTTPVRVSVVQSSTNALACVTA